MNNFSDMYQYRQRAQRAKNYVFMRKRDDEIMLQAAKFQQQQQELIRQQQEFIQQQQQEFMQRQQHEFMQRQQQQQQQQPQEPKPKKTIIITSTPFQKACALFGLSEKDALIDKVKLKKTYKKMALKWHPDRNKAVDTTKKFQEMKSAYDLLMKN